ncbi:MAG: hypothetical protein ACTSRS_11430 [Candidatus Helarchaeota archaeon]
MQYWMMTSNEWIGFIFITLTMLVQFILAGRVVRGYIRSRAVPVLYISIFFVTWGSAMFCLFIERLYLIVNHSALTGIGFITSTIALGLSVFTVLFLNLYSYSVTFPNYQKKLRILAITLATILLISIVIAIKDIQMISPIETAFPEYLDIIFLFIGIPLFCLPIIIFFLYAHVTSSSSPPHSKRVTWLGIAVFLIVITYFPEIIGSTEIINYLRLFYLISMLIFYICFTRFQELSWPKKVHHLYVILPERGISLFDHAFIQEELLESQFIAGTLSGFFSMIQKFTKSKKKMRTVDHEDVKILLSYGEYVVACLITEEDYRILRKKLDAFVQAFEKQFKHQLTDFSGIVLDFQGAKKIVDKIFSYQEPI